MNAAYTEGRVEKISYLREGKEEGVIQNLSDTAVFLVNEEKWSLEKAMSLPSIPGELKETIEGEAIRKLGI